MVEDYITIIVQLLKINFNEVYEMARRNYEQYHKELGDESELTHYFEGQKEAYKYVCELMKHLIK